MELLSIGAFARASRLSPKALRLYDELGLLTPARVDPVNGYRFYARGQLEQARLVAWLRRLGMPLARIQQVCALDARDAAREVRAYWARVEADTAARRDLAAFLVEHLSRKDDPTMSSTTAPLAIRYAALSDRGLVRETNQDTAYAGSRLLAVADGFGTGGAGAAAGAVGALRELETDGIPAGALLNALEDAVELAGRAVQGVAAAGPDPQKVGTTLTAMLWTGSQLALVHIGDSRAYLLRGGELFRITHDHTLVQSLVDEGRLTPEEATSHPQRSLLVKALSGDPDPAGRAADIRLQDAEAGDRYLLCSDGLSTVVPEDDLGRVVRTAADPDGAVRELVALANRSGGPDNVSCVVADVVAEVVAA
ncbi:MerR family transcriptional regulator [Streptomyces sp. NBC_01476]|uniref:MerR family transcriptional regulator n=1 Tax=Streptomyces sp. NBC_01476 TaxID=2903881 RepID=UPI002E30ACE4|nr:MerR family transcriptional regulator [Streptomyces sp. NBC_01476]